MSSRVQFNLLGVGHDQWMFEHLIRASLFDKFRSCEAQTQLRSQLALELLFNVVVDCKATPQ